MQPRALKFSRVAIASVAHVDAPHRVTSAQLEQQFAHTLRRLRLPSNMLEGLSGIKARRFWGPQTQPSDAATMAAQAALEQAGIDPARVGLVINTSVCRDYVEPSVACLVHGNLGLSPACMNFDVANACLGFLNGMEIAGNMIERGQVDVALVVDGESSRYVVEQTIARLAADSCTQQTLRDNFATLTLGSGAAAMVLVRADLSPSRHRFVGSITMSATEHNHLCRGQNDHMSTDSTQLLKAGVTLAGQTWAHARQQLGWAPGGMHEFVMHQVSKVHTEHLSGVLGIDRSRVLAIYPEYGNVGPASVPIVLSKSMQAGRLGPGHRIALMGIGSGLNCTMAEIIW